MRRARCLALDFFLDIPLVPDHHRLVIVRAPRIYVRRPLYPMMVLESAEEISQALAENIREDGGQRHGQPAVCCVAPDAMPDAVVHGDIAWQEVEITREPAPFMWFVRSV